MLEEPNREPENLSEHHDSVFQDYDGLVPVPPTNFDRTSFVTEPFNGIRTYVVKETQKDLKRGTELFSLTLEQQISGVHHYLTCELSTKREESTIEARLLVTSPLLISDPAELKLHAFHEVVSKEELARIHWDLSEAFLSGGGAGAIEFMKHLISTHGDISIKHNLLVDTPLTIEPSPRSEEVKESNLLIAEKPSSKEEKCLFSPVIDRFTESVRSIYEMTWRKAGRDTSVVDLVWSSDGDQEQIQDLRVKLIPKDDKEEVRIELLFVDRNDTTQYVLNLDIESSSESSFSGKLPLKFITLHKPGVPGFFQKYSARPRGFFLNSNQIDSPDEWLSSLIEALHVQCLQSSDTDLVNTKAARLLKNAVKVTPNLLTRALELYKSFNGTDSSGRRGVGSGP